MSAAAPHPTPGTPPPPPEDSAPDVGSARGSSRPQDRGQNRGQQYFPESSAVIEPEKLRKLGPVRSTFARMRLSSKLALLVMAILFSGLVLASVLTATLLQRSLVQQVDADLLNTYSSIANQVLNEQTNTDNTLPSDYYMLIRTKANPTKPTDFYTDDTIEQHGLPNLELYMPNDMDDYSDKVYAKPFTTTSFTGDTEWRVAVREVFNTLTGKSIGYVYIALPLTETYETIDQIQRALLISAAAITALGGAIGVISVNRSLKPLSRMEQTAAMIAEGDLTQRVPQYPRDTEIGSLAQSLNTMLSQLELAFDEREQSESRMRRFVSDASHELRTPLATIRGYGELYRMGAIQDSEAMDDTMRRVEDSARRMASLVEDLLHLARLDERRAARSEPIDLAVLALDATSDLHALDPTRTVRLVGLDDAQPSGATTVLGDEDQLRQVFANLVGNIARYTPEGSAVEIALGGASEPEGEFVVVEFRDHGPGVNPEHASRIFERFYRIDSSRNRKSGGSGLGLAIVSAIIESHHGTVGVEQTSGGGLTVQVKLPFHKSSDASQPL